MGDFKRDFHDFEVCKCSITKSVYISNSYMVTSYFFHPSRFSSLFNLLFLPYSSQITKSQPSQIHSMYQSKLCTKNNNSTINFVDSRKSLIFKDNKNKISKEDSNCLRPWNMWTRRLVKVQFMLVVYCLWEANLLSLTIWELQKFIQNRQRALLDNRARPTKDCDICDRPDVRAWISARIGREPTIS